MGNNSPKLQALPTLTCIGIVVLGFIAIGFASVHPESILGKLFLRFGGGALLFGVLVVNGIAIFVMEKCGFPLFKTETPQGKL